MFTNKMFFLPLVIEQYFPVNKVKFKGSPLWLVGTHVKFVLVSFVQGTGFLLTLADSMFKLIVCSVIAVEDQKREQWTTQEQICGLFNWVLYIEIGSQAIMEVGKRDHPLYWS